MAPSYLGPSREEVGDGAIFMTSDPRAAPLPPRPPCSYLGPSREEVGDGTVFIIRGLSSPRCQSLVGGNAHALSQPPRGGRVTHL